MGTRMQESKNNEVEKNPHKRLISMTESLIRHAKWLELKYTSVKKDGIHSTTIVDLEDYLAEIKNRD